MNLFGENGGNGLVMLVVWVLLFVGFYFFIIRPQNKKRKAEEQLRNSLKIGDEITTIGGIVGRIVSIKEEADTLIVETSSDKNRIAIKRWAIAANDTNVQPSK